MKWQSCFSLGDNLHEMTKPIFFEKKAKKKKKKKKKNTMNLSSAELAQRLDTFGRCLHVL